MFYVIDGLDSCSKETQSNLLQDSLQKSGYDVKVVHFPNYPSTSSSLVKYIIKGGLKGGLLEASPYGVSAAFALDRYITFNNEPELTEYAESPDKILIADRYTSSNLIYQGVSFLGYRDKLEEFYKWCTNFEYKQLGIPKPNMTIILSLDKRVRDRLLYERYEGKPPYDVYESDKRAQDLWSKVCFEMSKIGGWRYVECGTKDNSSILEASEINKTIHKIVEIDIRRRMTAHE